MAHSVAITALDVVCRSVLGDHVLAFMVALTLTTVANVLVTMAIGPLLTALMSRMFLHHRLPLRAWSAIGVAGLGIVWMFGMEASQGGSFTGSLIALAIPLAASINFVIMQHVSHDKEGEITHDMLPAILIGAAISALVSLPLAWPLQANAHDVRLLALLGVAQLALPCLLMVRLTRQLSATEISLLGLLEVIFGVTWAWLGAGESPSRNTLIGGALVLGALAVNELLALRERNTPMA